MFQDSPQRGSSFRSTDFNTFSNLEEVASNLQDLLQQVQPFVPDSTEFSEVIAQSGGLAEAVAPEVLQWVSRYLAETEEEELNFSDLSLDQASASWVTLYSRIKSHLPDPSFPEPVVLAEIFFVASKVATAVAAELRSSSWIALSPVEVPNHSFSESQLKCAQGRIQRRGETGEGVVDILLECDMDPGEYATLMIEEAGALVELLTHRTFLKGVLLKTGPMVLRYVSLLAEDLHERIEQERRLAGRVCTLVDLAENLPYEECAQVVFRSMEEFLVPSLETYMENSPNTPLDIVFTYFRDIDTEQIACSPICKDPIRALRELVGDTFRPSLLMTALNRRGILMVSGKSWGRYPLYLIHPPYRWVPE